MNFVVIFFRECIGLLVAIYERITSVVIGKGLPMLDRGLMKLIIYMQLIKPQVHNINRKKLVAYSLIDIHVYLAHSNVNFQFPNDSFVVNL